MLRPDPDDFNRKCLEGIRAQGIHPKPDTSKCWFCQGEGRVEWDGFDEDGNVEQGVYDPCPECVETGKTA